MQEIWKDVKDYEGLYQISNLGRVKSFRASSKYGNPKEMLLKPSLISSGYCVVTLYSKEKPIVQKTLDGHKLATYQSMHIASELLGIEYSKIKSWCKIGIGGGYIWEHI